MQAPQSQGCPEGGPGLVYLVDLKVYTLSAIKKACYAIGGQATAAIEVEGDQARVTLFPRVEAPRVDLGEFFRQELLDQDLRESIAAQTEPLRNLILAHALSKVPLLHPELEGDSPED